MMGNKNIDLNNGGNNNNNNYLTTRMMMMIIMARVALLLWLGLLHSCECFSAVVRHRRSGIALPHFHPPIVNLSSSSSRLYGRLSGKGDSRTFELLMAQQLDDASTTAGVVVVERPDPASLLSAQSDAVQRIGFVAICVSILVGTVAVVNLLTGLENLLPTGWFALWRDYTWPVPLGLVFVAAGIGHFAAKDSFAAMVPPVGTWGGLWQVPAPGADKMGLTYADYHVYWSGLAETAGGLCLVAGGLADAPQLPALGLLALTAAVTPANIYMATHDIRPPGDMPPIPYPWGHAFRFAMQSVLLGLFFKLAFL